MARFTNTPGIEIYKLERRYMHAKRLNGNVSFTNDILPAAIAYQRSKTLDNIQMRELSFFCAGFKIYKISRLFVSIPGRFSGFDIYLDGELNGERQILASYKKLEKRTYSLIRVCELGGVRTSEAKMVVRYFTNCYLRRKCRFTITEKLK